MTTFTLRAYWFGPGSSVMTANFVGTWSAWRRPASKLTATPWCKEAVEENGKWTIVSEVTHHLRISCLHPDKICRSRIQLTIHLRINDKLQAGKRAPHFEGPLVIMTTNRIHVRAYRPIVGLSWFERGWVELPARQWQILRYALRFRILSSGNWITMKLKRESHKKT